MDKSAMPERIRAGLFTSVIGTAALLLLSGAASADSGFYVGGSVGSATIAAEVPDLGTTPFDFDENDFGWKIHGGYLFDLPVLDLGIEAGYVDLGAPSFDILGDSLTIDVTGLSLFGLAGIDLGPVGVFGKVGMINWDAEVSVSGFGEVASDDGSDPAYGIGVRFALGSIEIRGEYEMFDVDDTDDVYMLSAGLVWRF